MERGDVGWANDGPKVEELSNFEQNKASNLLMRT